MSVNYGGGSPQGGYPQGGYPGDGGAGGYALSAGRVDLGAWLGRGWALFSAQPVTWIAAFLLYLVLGSLLWLLWAVPTGTLAALERAYSVILHPTTFHPAPPPQNPVQEFAKTHVFGLLMAACNAVFYGGFYKMALRQARGEAISVGGVFSGFPQALPLAMVAVALAAAIVLLEALSQWLLHLARVPPTLSASLTGLIALLPTFVLQGLAMFAPLLVVDKSVNAADAIGGSVRLLKSQWLTAVLTYFILALIGGLGVLGCLVGMLVTYPLFLISVAAGYLAFTQPPPSAPYPYSNAYGSPAPPGVWPPPPGAAPPPLAP